ncbi:pectinesterase [Artemisia annua]|uniref:Pectinesterase n=1 Tax=Artemisia annua TaxID=35608 RepID=A0A2U1LGI1_ARTAN|nr:pectinesterase [Artemisia annua]
MTLIILFAPLLFASLVHGTSEESSFRSSSLSSSSAHSVIKSSCSITLYPELCYSTLYTTTITQELTKKDVIELAVNKTKETIQANFHTINNLLTPSTYSSLTKRAQTALRDCLDMTADTLEGLDILIQQLRDYPNKKSLHQQADDLKTIMSTAITYRETCLDDLTYDDDDDASKQSSTLVMEGQDLGGKMCSNILAMIKNMTDTDIANNSNKVEHVGRRRLKDEVIWPKWLSVVDRKQLWFFGVTPNVIVAQNGKGNYTTIAAAVAAAPMNSTTKYVIKITAGVYKENIEIPKHMNNIMFVGDGRENTIITGNRNVSGGDGMTTTNSATVAVMGERFLARDITFQNTAGPSGGQAVALRVNSDLSAFYKCGMDGYQDTLYVVSNRQFYVKCFIIGTVDFIFGNAAVVFQFCDIHARKPNLGQRNMVTAQGRTDMNQNTGIVIQKCSIDATADLKETKGGFPTYLGRPWKEFSRTVVMQSSISDIIDSEGWFPWDKEFALDTLYYREYQNMGPGSDTSKRVKWKGWGVMKSDTEARPFTVSNFINGWTWLLSTGFPFWPIL